MLTIIGLFIQSIIGTETPAVHMLLAFLVTLVIPYFSANRVKYITGMLHFLMYSFIILMANLFYLKTYDSCQIKITLLHIDGALITAMWLIKRIETGEYFKFGDKEKYFILPPLIYLLSGLLSYAITPLKATSHFEAIKRIVFFGLFMTAFTEFRSEKDYKRLFYSILWAGVITTFYGIVQTLDFKFFPMSRTPKGLDPFLWRQAFTSRIFSTFGNPNFYAAFLVLISPMIIMFYMLTRKVYLIILWVCLIICVYYTHSKGSWIGLPAGLVLAALLSVLFTVHADKKKINRIIVGGTAILSIASMLGVAILIKGRIDSVRFRVFTWQATWEMIRRPIYISPAQSQLFGHGLGTFLIVYPAYRMSQIFYIEGKHNTETDHPENEYLEIWYDEGIIGLGVWLWFLVTVFFSSWANIKSISESLSAVQKKLLTSQQTARLHRQYILTGTLAGYFGLLTHNLMCVNGRFVSSGTFFWIIPGFILSMALSGQSLPVIKPAAKKEKAVSAVQLTPPYYIPGLLLASVFAMVFAFYGFRYFFADMHHNKAIAYSKAGLWDKALEDYMQVIRLNPYYIMTHYFMGNVFNDRWDQRTTVNQKVDFDYNNIQDKFGARNDAQRAIWKYSDVKDLAPNYVQTHFQVGVVYNKLEMWEDAIENFSKAIDLDPVFPQNYFRAGWAYVRTGDWANAEKSFLRAIEKKPEEPDSYINLGNVYFTEKKYREAEEVYLKAAEVSPKNPNVYKNLYSFYQSQNRLGDFQKLLQRMNVSIDAQGNVVPAGR